MRPRHAPWALACMFACSMSACTSIYDRTAVATPTDARARLRLRIAEARETALAAERALADASVSTASPVQGASEASPVDRAEDCRWELDRRVESIRDVASRLTPPDPEAADVLASFDRARVALALTLSEPGWPSSPDLSKVQRALSSLNAAVACVDRVPSPAPPLAQSDPSLFGPPGGH